MQTCLIVEGGGFRTAFTAGVLDAFIVNEYFPFTHCVGISGGSVAVSYYMSKQYRSTLKAMIELARNKNFTQFRRSFGKEGYMDIDFIMEVSRKKVPFDIDKAIEISKSVDVHFIATDKKNGNPFYLKPSKETWIDYVIASSTLPFVTKGIHVIDGQELFDGGWSDPLPLKWAYKQGAKKIVLLRTRPVDQHLQQSWSDYFASMYYRDNKQLQNTFMHIHTMYNEAIKFIANPPADLEIIQIAPVKDLKSGVTSYSKKTIVRDYRYGVDFGLGYLNHQKLEA